MYKISYWSLLVKDTTWQSICERQEKNDLPMIMKYRRKQQIDLSVLLLPLLFPFYHTINSRMHQNADQVTLSEYPRLNIEATELTDK